MSVLNYGLTNKDLIQARYKVAAQKDFLESHSFLNNETGEVKTLLDFSYSANVSERYYSRILNKVDTFVTFNMARGYTPIFMTITLDGFFRDFLRGDYTRWDKKFKHKYDSMKVKAIPNNDRNGHYRDEIERKRKMSPKDLYKILSHQLHNFIRSSTLQKIRKEGKDYSFIRVTEPHKDGTPHFHILMYIPNEYLAAVHKEFVKFFPAPQNHKKITMKQDKREPKKLYDKQYETKGFQIEIKSPAGYLLKYILKSFTNLIKGDKLDYLQAWYIHNRIPRIITTHTLIDQHTYHHASLIDNDWYYLTMIKNDGKIEKDNIFNTFHLVSDSDREIIFENGKYTLINKGKLIMTFGENKMFKMKFTEERPYNIIPNDIQYASCIFHKINFVHWRLVPKSRKYYYKIIEMDKYIELEIEEETFYINKVNGKILNIEDIDISNRLEILKIESSSLPLKSGYKHSFKYS